MYPGLSLSVAPTLTSPSKPIRRPALKQVLKKFAPIPEETEGSPREEKTEAAATQKADDESKSNGATVPPNDNG